MTFKNHNPRLSFIEILNAFTPLSCLGVLVYVQNSMNQRLSEIHGEISRSTIEINRLNIEINKLKNTLGEKDQLISSLNAQLNKIKSDFVAVDLSQPTSDIVIQSGLSPTKTFGIIIIFAFGYGLCQQWLPSLFSAKTLLPKFLYNNIQAYTPFLQEKITFTTNHKSFLWLVEILNNKTVNVKLKPPGTDDFVNGFDYVSKLHLESLENANILSSQLMSNPYGAVSLTDSANMISNIMI